MAAAGLISLPPAWTRKIDIAHSASRIKIMAIHFQSQEFITWVFKRLRPRFGEKPQRKDRDLTAILIRTVLSQNTNDRNRDRAYLNLKRKFPRWEHLLAARQSEIERAIRVGGLSRQKAKRIKDILAGIKKDKGKFDLSFLCRSQVDDARKYLLGFKGIGEKTAAVVLLFGCGMPLFPVDTHILRVTKRLGVLPPKTTAEKAHQLLAPLVPGELCYELHLNLIQEGRKICHARKPECPACPLNTRCLYYRKVWKINERAA